MFPKGQLVRHQGEAPPKQHGAQGPSKPRGCQEAGLSHSKAERHTPCHHHHPELT